jgi:TetR/AcrR family transcriptional regulator, regulator of cefoperazone and chloramphenicol sensitivity
MKIPREDTMKTRGLLLEAAAEIFALKGYRDATIAEICGKAKANIAAVNYHFRDKESLYREAWRLSLLESLKNHPTDGGVSDKAAPEEKLKGQIKAFLDRITDENNREFMIVQREFANPTGLLDDIMREEMQPLQARTQSLIRELLGPYATDTQIQFCEISIISQCINPAITRKGHNQNQDKDNNPPGIDDIKTYAEHVVSFSLGGIRAILKEIKLKSKISAK